MLLYENLLFRASSQTIRLNVDRHCDFNTLSDYENYFCVCGLEKLVLQNCGGYFAFAIWDWNEVSLTSYCKWIFSLTEHKTNTICRNAKLTDMFVTETITKIVLRIYEKSLYMLLSKKIRHNKEVLLSLTLLHYGPVMRSCFFFFLLVTWSDS